MTPSRWIAACVCAAALTVSAAAHARTPAPVGPNAKGMSPNSGVVPAQILANERTAYFYFLQKGLSAVQSAGIIGNLDVESGMNPTAQQSGGPGRGIAQWSAGGRWDTSRGDNVVAYASQRGVSPWALNTQLDFTWFELTTFPGYGLSQLRAAQTINAAVVAFQDEFEGCGACNTSNRVTYAQSAYDRYGGGRSATAGGTVVSLGSTEVDYFSRSAGNRLVQHRYLTISGWQPEVDLGAPTSGLTWDPDATTNGPSHIDIAARDASGHLAIRSWSNGAWSKWYVQTDTALLSSPSIVDSADGQVSVFWLGANQQLLCRTWTASAGWGDVLPVPGVTNIASGPDALTWEYGSGHLDIIYRAADASLWTVTFDRRWRAPARVNPTHPLSVSLARVDPAGGTTGPGDFSVFVTTTDGNVYHASGNTLTGAWTLWYPISGSPRATAAPDVATLGESDVYVVTAANGVLITSHWTSPRWSPWQPA